MKRHIMCHHICTSSQAHKLLTLCFITERVYACSMERLCNGYSNTGINAGVRKNAKWTRVMYNLNHSLQIGIKHFAGRQWESRATKYWNRILIVRRHSEKWSESLRCSFARRGTVCRFLAVVHDCFLIAFHSLFLSHTMFRKLLRNYYALPAKRSRIIGVL